MSGLLPPQLGVRAVLRAQQENCAAKNKSSINPELLKESTYVYLALQCLGMDSVDKYLLPECVRHDMSTNTVV